METLRKHGALVLLGIIIAAGSYNLGFNKGEESVPAAIAPALENRGEGEPSAIDFSPFWKAWNLINEKYVPASTTAKRVGDQEKVWGAIEGLAASLNDPYTVFFPPVESKLFESDIRGNFEGVGMEVLAQEGAITVIAPLKNSPAERAGIIAGDKIIRINSTPTSGLSTEDAVQMIRGPRGTEVTLTVFRNGRRDPFEVTIERATIDIPTIASHVLPGNVFKIDLYSFSAQSPNLFRASLREFILSKSDKLILDLRGNPGGYLEAAIDMASWFLPPSKVIVREDFGPSREEKVYRSRGYDIFTDKLKFVILVDKGSASASEILAGALQEHGEAVIVGEETFGKGSVQELIDITSETSLKITVARWLTPNGLSISEKGIEPDYIVKRTTEDMAANRDPQLDKALEVLNSMQ
jgi:carboxyl-terminal processing protease